MKKNYFLLGIILTGITLPAFAFAVPEGWSYERLPVGTEITTPVSVIVSVDNLIRFDEDIQSGCIEENNCKWWVRAYIFDGVNESWTDSEKVPISLYYNHQLILPIGYQPNAIFIMAGNLPYVATGVLEPVDEENYETPIFTITGEEAGGGFLEVPIGAIGDILTPAGILFSDTWSFIGIAIGLPLAFYIIGKVIGFISL